MIKSACFDCPFCDQGRAVRGARTYLQGRTDRGPLLDPKRIQVEDFGRADGGTSRTVAFSAPLPSGSWKRRSRCRCSNVSEATAIVVHRQVDSKDLTHAWAA